MRENLKKARIKKNLTHDELAEKLKIKRATYTNIELGNRNPSLDLAMKIKKVLDYDKDDIFLNSKCRKGTKK